MNRSKQARMGRKTIIVVWLVGLALASPSLAAAQQPKHVPRIGFLFTASPAAFRSRIDAFRQGLQDLGYIEGRNIVTEYRYAEGKQDLATELAAELIRLKVDLIVTSSTPGILAIKKVSSTIPIVFTSISDPVAIGLVASLARPGGNMTGLTILGPELSGKRLELLKESFPNIKRVAILWNPDAEVNAFKTTQAAASTLGLHLQSLEVRTANDFDSLFEAAIKERVQALLTIPTPVVNVNQARIIQFAAKNRLPAMYALPEFTDAGGLMSYAPSYTALYHRAAWYVDKILKGANPADLPVEQPKTFEFIINLKTAKQLGLTIPPNVLVRADKVIK